ncbi:hypothetical protein QVD17_37274 [Tagetes erecta]|uniref:Uncharacterized protein n=1 Tax=Tagetes erecta TaxID=13708 RepID=A0AAD8JTS3_TARER|nr:hypothetical protein QVD17_37274 [Tagetes erecta]
MKLLAFETFCKPRSFVILLFHLTFCKCITCQILICVGCAILCLQSCLVVYWLLKESYSFVFNGPQPFTILKLHQNPFQTSCTIRNQIIHRSIAATIKQPNNIVSNLLNSHKHTHINLY